MTRIIRITIFLLAVLALQSALFGRLALWGAYPDLILVAVIVFASLNDFGPAFLMAFFLGFFGDLMGWGHYLDTLTRPLAVAAVSFVKENFIEDNNLLPYYMVLLLTPLLMLFKALIGQLAFNWGINWLDFLAVVFLATLYNLALTPLMVWVVKKGDLNGF